MFVLNTCHSKENEKKIWIRNTDNTEYPLHPQLRILGFLNFKVNCLFSAGHGIYLYIIRYLTGEKCPCLVPHVLYMCLN